MENNPENFDPDDFEQFDNNNNSGESNSGAGQITNFVHLAMIIFLAVMLGMYLRVRQAMIP